MRPDLRIDDTFDEAVHVLFNNCCIAICGDTNLFLAGFYKVLAKGIRDAYLDGKEEMRKQLRNPVMQ